MCDKCKASHPENKEPARDWLGYFGEMKLKELDHFHLVVVDVDKGRVRQMGKNIDGRDVMDAIILTMLKKAGRERASDVIRCLLQRLDHIFRRERIGEVSFKGLSEERRDG